MEYKNNLPNITLGFQNLVYTLGYLEYLLVIISMMESTSGYRGIFHRNDLRLVCGEVFFSLRRGQRQVYPARGRLHEAVPAP